MGSWSSNSKTHVSSMNEGDFFGTEKSITTQQDEVVKIVMEGSDNSQNVLKENLELLADEVIDTACMDMSLLEAFLNKEIKAAKKEGLLFSLHMKATMMKVSDPIIFWQMRLSILCFNFCKIRKRA